MIGEGGPEDWELESMTRRRIRPEGYVLVGCFKECLATLEKNWPNYTDHFLV